MELSLIGALITFQVTFTELFIASTVIASVGYKNGWRSAALGSVIGAVAVAILGFILGTAGSKIPMQILDWVSTVLLLGFGLWLFYEFWSAHKKGEGAASIDRGLEISGSGDGGSATALQENIAKPVNWAGVSVAAWGMFAEGLEIAVVWLAIALKHGMATATLGVVIGLGIIVIVALLLGKAGIFEKIPTKYLDLMASIMLVIYGIYFLYSAITGTFTVI